MHVLVSGSSGLIGSALVGQLGAEGHRVTRLVRREAAVGEVGWDPQAGKLDADLLTGVDGVVHLAGEDIAAARWTAAQKQRIRDSRVAGTRLLCEALARMSCPPRVLVSASAIGIYGDRGNEWLDEDSVAGQGFLPGVVRAWEAATEPAVRAGIRVVLLRFGVVLSPRGGALARMLLPFRLGGGGPMGGGRQYWSWISLEDAVGAVLFALATEALSGPANAVSPHPVTNAEFAKVLGKVLGRPAIVPLPAWALRLALGELADALLLASARVRPSRLLQAGYDFRWPDLELALRHLVRQPP